MRLVGSRSSVRSSEPEEMVGHSHQRRGAVDARYGVIDQRDHRRPGSCDYASSQKNPSSFDEASPLIQTWWWLCPIILSSSGPPTIPNAEPAQGCSHHPALQSRWSGHASTAERRWVGMPNHPSRFAIPNWSATSPSRIRCGSEAPHETGTAFRLAAAST